MAGHSWRVGRVLVVVVALLAIALGVNAGRISNAYAAVGANVTLTGHDMDYHCYYGDANECAYLRIVLNLVRNGSTLPVLVLDQGVEVQGAITNAYGASAPVVQVVNPTTPVWTSLPLVDAGGHALYSALITASDTTCGGCDNTAAGEAAINARSSDIVTYFNDGGGILALAGANNFSTYYNFVPVTATGAAVTYPFAPTTYGASLGITSTMANCCATHNSFQNPPAGSALQVAETDGAGLAETLIATGASIGGGGFTGDTTPPSCVLKSSGVDAAGQKYIVIATQDSDGGLAASPNGIVVTGSSNATISIPSYTANTTSEVDVTATKIDQTMGSSVSLRVTDAAGNITDCDPAILNLSRVHGKPASTTVHSIAKGEHYVHVYNGTPGVTNLSVSVNGKNFQVSGLAAGEKRTIDVSSALGAGSNSVTLTATGAPGGSVISVIADS